MEFTGSIQFADESSWLTLTTESDDAVTIKVTFTSLTQGTEVLSFDVTPNSGIVRLPAGEILRALINEGGSAVDGNFQATQGSSSCSHSFRVFPCREFSYTNIYTAIFSTRPKTSPAYEGGKDTLSFFNSTMGATSAYVRFRFKNGSVSSNYSLYVPVNTRTASLYSLDVSYETMMSVATTNGLVTSNITGYDIWIEYSGSKSETYSFEIRRSRLPLKTYKFLGRRGTYEYIHATGKFSRSIESETQVFVTSGIEEELANDSTMDFEQNSGHIDSIGMGAYWLEFFASKERYVIEKDGSERQIIVDEYKTTLADRAVGSLTFKWHYANPNNTVIDKVEIALTGLVISGDSSVYTAGNTAQFSVTYTPSNTTQRGVSWSIVSGTDYASIDESGKLTVKSGANGHTVKIRATSKVNASVYAEKTISVAYYATEASITFQKDSIEVAASAGAVQNTFTTTNLKDLTVAASGGMSITSGPEINGVIVGFAYAENTESTTKTTTITVTGTRTDGEGTYSKSFTVVQAAAAASSELTPKIELESDSVTAQATSTEYSMLFSAENLTDLTAACTGTLVNASARVNTSSRIIKVSFAANTTTVERVGTVTVTGTRVDGNGTYSKSFTVVQAAAAVETYLRVTPASVTLSGTCASDAGNADLTVESNQGWTATCEADWLNLLTDTGTGDDTVNIGVNMDNNTGAERSTSVVFTGADGTVVTVAVTQAAIENADPAEFTVTREAVSGTEWELVTQAMADEDSALSDFVGWHKSGIAGTANGETVTKLTFNVTAAGAVTVEFCSDAESKYDYLVAAAMDESTELTRTNADTLAEVTTKDNQGIVNKVTKTYDLTVGTHTLQILYRKDGSRDEGTDSGYYRVLSESSDAGTDLPEGYEAVDYIASKGTSGSLTGDLPYIDTGIINESNQTYHVEFTMYPESESGVSRTTYPFIMGSMSAKNTGTTVKQIYTGNFPGGNSSYGTTGMTGEQSGAWGGNRSGGNCIVLFGVLAPGQRHMLDWNYDHSLVSVDGDTASGKIVGSSSTTVGTSNSCYLFAVNTAGSPVDGNGNDQRRGWQKLHRFWIKDYNGTLLCDLYPCKNADGVYGLYDTVRDMFLTSANDKTFTGPDDE